MERLVHLDVSHKKISKELFWISINISIDFKRVAIQFCAEKRSSQNNKLPAF